MKDKNKSLILLCGFLSGLVNGIFGAGAGIICVPMLKKAKLTTTNAHSTSIAIVLPLCAVSSIFYITKDNVMPIDALPFIIGGCIGAPFGAFLLRKIPEIILKRGFGIFMIYSSIRMLF